MWAGLADFIDRSPRLAGKLAIPFLVVGGALQGALWLGFVKKTAFNGAVAQATPVIWVVGLALCFVWLLWTMTKVPDALGNWSSRRSYGQQVNANLQFLDVKSRFLLLVILTEQNGRMPNSTNQSFENLASLGILELETEFAGNFNSHGVYRVSKFIKDREKLARTLATNIESLSHIDVSTQEGRRRYLQMYPGTLN